MIDIKSYFININVADFNEKIDRVKSRQFQMRHNKFVCMCGRACVDACIETF